MRRIGVTLLLLALFVAALAVLQRGMEIRSDPDTGLIDPFKGITVPERPSRERPAERPATPPPRSVRVAVTSMDGTPIPGARVELVPGPADELRRAFVPSAAAPPRGRAVTAGEDGSATVEDVPPGRWFVVGEAPGFARHALAGVVREGDDPVATTVALEKGHTFSGTIRDPDGAPAAGITVILVPRATFVSDATCLRTTTAKDGSYRFESVEAGEHGLWYVPHADVCVLETMLRVPQVDGLDIRMSRGAAIEGTVHDADTGAAVAGARVLALNYSGWGVSGMRGLTVLLDTGTTDELGRFSMRTWRRRTNVGYLLVDADGYLATPVDRGGDLRVVGAEEGQRFVADLRIRRAGGLTGAVTVLGRPLAGANVRVEPQDPDTKPLPGDRAWCARTGTDGRFRIDRLPAGPAAITVIGDQPFTLLAEAVSVEVEAGHETVRDVALEPRRVRVTRSVAAEAESPVPWADVDVVQRIGQLRASARTDADGRFTIDAWFFGDHAPVELRRREFAQAAWISADDEDGANVFPTPPAGDVAKGIVLDADSAPAIGVRVEVLAGMEGPHDTAIVWRGVRETISGPDGTFRVPVASGPEVSAWAARTPWADMAQDEDGELRVLLPDVFRFDGRVVASDTGDPIARALVFDDDDILTARTDAQGRFEVAGAPSAIRRVRVVSDGRLAETDEPEPEAWVISLRPALSLAGIVRRADGSAARGAFVRVGGSDRGAEVTTDHDGRFVASDLDAGPCDIEVSDPRHCTIVTSHVIAQAGTRDVTFEVRDAVRVVVRVRNPDGSPVWGADVTVRSESQARDEVAVSRFDAAEFAFAAAPGASYAIRVEFEGCKPAERLDVRAGADPITIVLQPVDDE